jgi:hypothetical protein
MVFERIYKNPITMWGLFGDLLVYNEDLSSEEAAQSSSRNSNRQPEDEVFMDD